MQPFGSGSWNKKPNVNNYPNNTGSRLRHFHRDIHLPESILADCSGRYLRLRYTANAHENALSHEPALPFLGHITLLKKDIVEATLDDQDRIVSLATRISCGRRGDLFLSLEPFFDRCAANVKCTWLNHAGTTRVIGRTKSDYERAPGQRIPYPTPVLRNPAFPVFQALEVAV